MAVADLAFKMLTAGLGVTTIYLAGTFSVNVYRGLSWHSEQSKLEKAKTEDRERTGNAILYGNTTNRTSKRGEGSF